MLMNIWLDTKVQEIRHSKYLENFQINAHWSYRFQLNKNDTTVIIYIANGLFAIRYGGNFFSNYYHLPTMYFHINLIYLDMVIDQL